MKKTLFSIFRIVLFFICLEIFFRLGGVAAVQWQNYQNKKDLNFQNEYRILCLGESMTYEGGEQAYPAQLERILNTQLKPQQIKMINKAIPGGNSTQILAGLPQWLKEYRPSMVIVMMGLSDEPFFKTAQNRSAFSFLHQALLNIKVYKLSQKLWIDSRAYFFEKYKIGKPIVLSPVEFEGETNEILKRAPATFGKLYVLATVAEGRNNLPQAERLYRQLADADVDPMIKARLRRDLGNVLRKEKKYVEFAQLLEEILTINPADFWAMEWVWRVCGESEFAHEVSPVLQKVNQANPSVPALEDLLGGCMNEMGQKDKAEQHFLKAKQLREGGTNPLTQKNYAALLKLLSEEGTQIVVMQYPRRPLAELKTMLASQDTNEKIIFIDNEEIFEEALVKGAYADYFKDRAGGNFGHLTVKGHTLLAEHLAKEVLRLLK